MPDFQRGDEVIVEAFGGARLTRRALSDVVQGKDFLVVWVCRPEEWAAAEAEHREPDGVPWPAEDVQPVNGTVRV